MPASSSPLLDAKILPDNKSKGSMAAPLPRSRRSGSQSQPKNQTFANKVSASVSREHSSEGIFTQIKTLAV